MGEVISSDIPSSSSLAPKSNYSSGKRNNTAISVWLRTLGLVSCFRLMLSVPFGDSEQQKATLLRELHAIDARLPGDMYDLLPLSYFPASY